MRKRKRGVLLFSFALLSLQLGRFIVKNEAIPDTSAADTSAAEINADYTTPKIAFKGIGKLNGEKQVILGSTGPQSGSLYKLGRDFAKSMGIVFNEANRKNKLSDYFIKLILKDDEYEKSKISENIESILDKTSILFGMFSSDSLYAIPENRFKDILVLFPDAGVSKFRDPKYDSVFFYRPSTKQEIKILVDHVVKKLFKKKIAIFYEDSFWGSDGADAAKEYLKSFAADRVECVASEPYIRNTVNVNEAVEKIIKVSPEAVICIAHYRPTYSFIRRMLNRGQQKVDFLGVSETALMWEYLKKSRGVSLTATSVVPNPWISKLDIAKKYREAMQKYLPNLKFSSISFEGFIMASLLVKVLEKISPPITKEKIIDSIKSFENFYFEGLKINFDPKTKALSNSIWLNTSKYVDWDRYEAK